MGMMEEFPKDLADFVRREAEVADLSNTAAIRALIAGAIKDGQMARLISIGVDLLPSDLVKRRGDARRQEWVMVKQPRTKGPQPQVWKRGAYRMKRQGWPRRQPRPGDGWYLTGPGLSKPQFLSLVKDEAVELANQTIASLDSKRRNAG